jgi:hypothetical protein
MAIIYTYPLKATPILTDSVVITDSADDNKTKITSIQALFAAGLPGTGTVTSIKLDFASNAIDTGLRLWNTGGAAFTDTSQTYTTVATFEVGGTLNAGFGGTGQHTYTSGDILYYNATPSKLDILPKGADTQVLTLAGGLPTWAAPAGGGGTVTSVTTVNAIGASSGIKFLANPNPIIGAGVIDFEYLGNKGDILYADSTTSLKQLGAGLDRSVLTVVGGYPAWRDRLHVKDEGVTIDVSVDTMDFVGAGVTVTNTGGGPASGNVTVTIPGGGGGATAAGTFIPILVTQGADGTGTLLPIANQTYLEQYGRYYIQGDQLYIDFYIVFRPADEVSFTYPTETLGVSAWDELATNEVLGLQGIDPLAATLNTTQKNNAGVHITELFNDKEAVDEGWHKAPRGGKLNKFYGVGTDSAKSVAWFHWVKYANGAPPGYLPPVSLQYDTGSDPWTSSVDFEGGAHWTIAGSLNPINVLIL